MNDPLKHKTILSNHLDALNIKIPLNLFMKRIRNIIYIYEKPDIFFAK